MASSIACNLALGKNIIDSIKISKDFVYNAIENAPENLGKGFGPINHF
jgi:hydroxymethylpyrimidine/phosphomethylpyrimidine kinase